MGCHMPPDGLPDGGQWGGIYRPGWECVNRMVTKRKKKNVSTRLSCHVLTFYADPFVGGYCGESSFSATIFGPRTLSLTDSPLLISILIPSLSPVTTCRRS